jgi:TolB-like protein
MKIVFSFFAVLVLFQSNSAYTKEKMRTAVIDLVAKGVSKNTASSITDFIRSDFVDSGQFVVVERSQMSEILKEQGLQMSGCTDNACAVEVGKLLSAKKILIGEVSKVGKTYYITIRIVDIEKGVAEFSSREKSKNLDEIDKATRRLSIKLIERITGKSASEIVIAGQRTKSGYYLRGIFPGWSQFYSGNNTRGFIFSGTFILAGTITAYAIFDYNKKDKEYDDLPYGTSESVFSKKHDAAKNAGYITLAAISTVSLVYVIHWIDVIFFSGNELETADLGNPRRIIPNGIAIIPRYDNLQPVDKGFNLFFTMKF